MELLEDECYDPEKDRIFRAILDNDIETVKECLESGFTALSKGSSGDMVLHFTCLNSNLEVLELLREILNDGDIDVLNEVDNTICGTALHMSMDGQVDCKVVELLLKWGADPNANDAKGSPVLHELIYRGWEDFDDEFDSEGMWEDAETEDIESLVETSNYSCDEDSTPNEGQMESTGRKGDSYFQKLTLLFKYSADINGIHAATKMSALHFWCQCFNWSMEDKCGREIPQWGFRFLELMLQYGADPNLSNERGDSTMIYLSLRHFKPEHIAFKDSYRRLLKMIIPKVDNWEMVNMYGRTLLHSSVENSNTVMVEELVDLYKNVNKQDKFGLAPLHICTHNITPDEAELVSGMILTLTLNKAEVNIQDDNGLTPLHHAIHFKNYTAIGVLLRCGADVDIKDRLGRSCVDIALILRNEDILRLLNLPSNEGRTNACSPKFDVIGGSMKTCSPRSYANEDTQVCLPRYNIGVNEDSTPPCSSRLNMYEDTQVCVKGNSMQACSMRSDISGNADSTQSCSPRLNMYEDTQVCSPRSNIGVFEESTPTSSVRGNKSIKEISMQACSSRSDISGNEDSTQACSPWSNNSLEGDTSCSLRSDISGNDDTTQAHSPRSDISLGWYLPMCCHKQYSIEEAGLEHTETVSYSSVDDWLMKYPLCQHNRRAILQNSLKSLEDNKVQVQLATTDELSMKSEMLKLALKVSKAVKVMNPLFESNVIFGGSVSEGTKIGSSDEFDIVFDLFRMKEDTELTKNDVVKGFVQLKVKNTEVFSTHGLTHLIDDEGYLNRTETSKMFHSYLEKALSQKDIWADNRYLSFWGTTNSTGECYNIGQLNVIWYGPWCVRQDVSVDIAPIIRLSGWTSRNANKDAKIIDVKTIESIGCYLMMKDASRYLEEQQKDSEDIADDENVNNSKNWDSLFKVSISQVEHGVMHSLPSVIKNGYKIAKCAKMQCPMVTFPLFSFYSNLFNVHANSSMEQQEDQIQGVDTYIKQSDDQTQGVDTSNEQPDDQIEGVDTSMEQPEDQFKGVDTSMEQPEDQFHGVDTSMEQPEDEPQGVIHIGQYITSYVLKTGLFHELHAKNITLPLKDIDIDHRHWNEKVVNSSGLDMAPQSREEIAESVAWAANIYKRILVLLEEKNQIPEYFLLNMEATKIRSDDLAFAKMMKVFLKIMIHFLENLKVPEDLEL